MAAYFALSFSKMSALNSCAENSAQNGESSEFITEHNLLKQRFLKNKSDTKYHKTCIAEASEIVKCG